MTLADIIVAAVQKRNATAAGRIADILRFKHGMTYQESFDFVCEQCRKRGVEPPELAAWDELLREADEEGGR